MSSVPSHPLSRLKLLFRDIPVLLRYEIGAIGFFVLLTILWPPFGLALEFTVCAFIVSLAWRAPCTRELMKQLPPFHRRLGCGLILLMVLGQMLDRPRKSFPCVSWTMYSNATVTSHTVSRLEAKLENGKIISMPLHPFSCPYLNVATKLDSLVVTSSSPSQKSRSRALVRKASLEKSIKDHYERLHPQQKICSLLLYRGKIDLHHLPKDPLVAWTLFYESSFQE